MDEMLKTATKPTQYPRPGNPHAATAAIKHDLSPVRLRTLLGRGLSVVPADSPLAPVIAERRNQIYTDLGGAEHLSRITLDLIDEYLTTWIYVSSSNAYAVGLEHDRISTNTGRRVKGIGIIDRRSHRVRPIIEQRNKLIETMTKLAS